MLKSKYLRKELLAEVVNEFVVGVEALKVHIVVGFLSIGLVVALHRRILFFKHYLYMTGNAAKSIHEFI